MLNIRQEQFDTLAAHQQAESELSYMAYFRGIIPEFCKNYEDDGLRALIRDGIASAREYDVREDPALRLYLTLCIVIAPDFHKEPATNHWLRMPSIEPSTKLDILANAISDQLPDAAR